jgi:hypothetical protein
MVLNGTNDYDALFTVPAETAREKLFAYLELRCKGM